MPDQQPGYVCYVCMPAVHLPLQCTYQDVVCPLVWQQITLRSVTGIHKHVIASGFGADQVGRGTMAMRRMGSVPSSAAGRYTCSRVSQASTESCTAPMSHAVVTPETGITSLSQCLHGTATATADQSTICSPLRHAPLNNRVVLALARLRSPAATLRAPTHTAQVSHSCKSIVAAIVHKIIPPPALL